MFFIQSSALQLLAKYTRKRSRLKSARICKTALRQNFTQYTQNILQNISLYISKPKLYPLPTSLSEKSVNDQRFTLVKHLQDEVYLFHKYLVTKKFPIAN